MDQEGKKLFNKRYHQHQSGREAENLAQRYLQEAGLQLLEQNFNCRVGEIDLVMREGNTTVFVEVRYRHKSTYGSAVESVDYRKQKKLINTALFYLQNHKSLNNKPCRFDVMAITSQKGNSEIEWIKNAFGH